MNIKKQKTQYFFEGKELTDLGLSISATKAHYETVHPSLMNCEIKKEITNEGIKITFEKKFAQKG